MFICRLASLIGKEKLAEMKQQTSHTASKDAEADSGKGSESESAQTEDTNK